MSYSEKAGFSGKDSNARKNRRRQGKRETMYDSIKETLGMGLQDLSSRVEDRTLWTSSVYRVARFRVKSRACNTLRRLER